jgi:hypothetical protein
MPYWHPYYAGVWKDAREVAAYVRRHYRSLRQRTLAFKDALFGSTLPREVIDAVSANLAILKSPRSCGRKTGMSGAGKVASPTKAAATAPAPTSGITPRRFAIFSRNWSGPCASRNWSSMDERGHVTFRSALPDGPIRPTLWHAAADGQLGGILKLYRDWQISGDTAWMKYPLPKAAASSIASHVGPRPSRRALRAASQHLRHRVLGTGRHVRQHLSRRAQRHER